MVPYADTEAWLGEDCLARAISRIGEWLGIDLDGARELLGATIRSRPNPWMRTLSFGLVNEGRALRVEAHPRPGIECPPLQLTLSSDTPLGRRSVTQTPWTGGATSFPLDSEIGHVAVQVHDSGGRLLEDRQATFLREIHIATRMKAGTRSVEVTDPHGATKSLTVDRWGDAGASRVGRRDAIADAIRQHERARERKALQRRGEFAYFGAFEKDAPERAQAFVRSLFREVRERCIVADPFLGAEEVRAFALFVGSLHARIHLLSAQHHLRRPASGRRAHGRILADGLQELQRRDPAFRPEVHVLGSNRLHDRFLVVDESVYHLGGSLNHLGHRAMAISRVPAPEPVMADLERWLDGEGTEPLHDWLARRGL